jgi:hypothetical protein
MRGEHLHNDHGLLPCHSRSRPLAHERAISSPRRRRDCRHEAVASRFKTAENATAPKAMSDSEMDKVTAGLTLSLDAPCAAGANCIRADQHVTTNPVGGPSNGRQGGASEHTNQGKGPAVTFVKP